MPTDNVPPVIPGVDQPTPATYRTDPPTTVMHFCTTCWNYGRHDVLATIATHRTLACSCGLVSKVTT